MTEQQSSPSQTLADAWREEKKESKETALRMRKNKVHIIKKIHSLESLVGQKTVTLIQKREKEREGTNTGKQQQQQQQQPPPPDRDSCHRTLGTFG
ncbi:hypothetical protein E2C01_039550 [Portunus trituberculatus]|uniref:Uncharacterized protein n=1 Tax=Portunus trituberculatus TaxID=210409 RepID=A0A5B7FNB9_PORTR|nr:hypothetical protein [Portunus trituberculatus]